MVSAAIDNTFGNRLARHHDELDQLFMSLYDDRAALQLSLAVAATRRLRYRVQLRERAPDDGKVHVDSGLDELRRNDADALAAPQLPFYFRYQRAYLLAAHEARELNRPLRHELRKLAAVLSLVDYAENLTLL